jgi:hypothetical protein
MVVTGKSGLYRWFSCKGEEKEEVGERRRYERGGGGGRRRHLPRLAF